MRRAVAAAGIALAAIAAALPARTLAGVELTLAGPESALIVEGIGAHAIRVAIDTGAKDAKDGASLRLQAELRPWRMLEPVAASGTATVPSQAGRQTATVPLTVPRLGLYDLTVSAFDQNGEPVGHRSTTYAAVPARSAVGPSDLGVCTHFAQRGEAMPRLLDLVRLAGFARIRDELYWSAVEKAPGAFVFPDQYTAYLTEASKRGLAPLVVLSFGNAAVHPEAFKQGSGFPTSPEAQKLFVRYAVACATRYGDMVKHWELWNEPHSFGKTTPAVYTQLLKEVYPALKAARPDAYLVSCGGGGAGGGAGGDWINGVVANGGLDSQDGFSIHPYMTPHSPDLGYPAAGSPIPRVSVPVVWKHLDGFTAAHPRSDGKRLDLWVTEIGWFDSPQPFAQGELVQAAYFARTMLLARRGPRAKAVFWYDFQDDGSKAESSEDNFGLVRHDLSPKPAYVAAAVLSALLGERVATQTLVDDGQAAAIRYGAGAGADAVVAVWTVGLQDGVVTLPLEAGTYQVYDWQGQARTLSADGAPVRFPARPLPQYLVRAGSATALGEAAAGAK